MYLCAMADLTWEIVELFGDRYKVLNPQNGKELGYGINHDILTPNKNTLLPPKEEYNPKLEEFWDAF